MTNRIDLNKPNQALYATLNERKLLPDLSITLFNIQSDEMNEYELPNDISDRSERFNKYSYDAFLTLNNITLQEGSYMYFIYNFDETTNTVPELIETGIIKIYNEYIPTPSLDTNTNYKIFE
jgi:hypothetical protein